MHVSIKKGIEVSTARHQ